MYICENRLSCPWKAKAVLASTPCWSAEPFKVVLKVKMISTACFITSLFKWFSTFERAVEWTVKDSLKDSLLPPPCVEGMKLHWLTARLEPAGEISTEKVSCPVRFEDQHLPLTLYIYIIYANNSLTVLLSGLCGQLFCHSFVYFTSCFNAI